MGGLGSRTTARPDAIMSDKGSWMGYANSLEARCVRAEEALRQIAENAPCTIEDKVRSKHTTFCARHKALAALAAVPEENTEEKS